MDAAGTLWAWTVQTASGQGKLMGRPSGSAASLTRNRTNPVYIDAQLVGTQWVIATCSDVGTLVVESIPAGTSGTTPTTPTTPGLNTGGTTPGSGGTSLTPPLMHPLVDPKTGLVTRPWALFFEQIRSVNFSQGTTGTIPREALPGMPALTVMGRGDSPGQPESIQVGTGLTIEDNVLKLA